MLSAEDQERWLKNFTEIWKSESGNASDDGSIDSAGLNV
jgi:hypothetical protein